MGSPITLVVAFCSAAILSSFPATEGVQYAWREHVCKTTPLFRLPALGCNPASRFTNKILGEVLDNWETSFRRYQVLHTLGPITYSLRISPDGLDYGRLVLHVRPDRTVPKEGYTSASAALLTAWDIAQAMRAPPAIFHWLMYLSHHQGVDHETKFPANSFAASSASWPAPPPGARLGNIIFGVSLVNEANVEDDTLDVKVYYTRPYENMFGTGVIGWDVGPFAWDKVDLHACDEHCQAKREATAAISLRWVLGGGSLCNFASPGLCEEKASAPVLYTYRESASSEDFLALFGEKEALPAYMRNLFHAMMHTFSLYLEPGEGFTGEIGIQEVLVPSDKGFDAHGMSASSSRAVNQQSKSLYEFRPRKMDVFVNLTHPLDVMQQHTLEWTAYLDGMVNPHCFAAEFAELEEAVLGVEGEVGHSFPPHPIINVAQHGVREAIQATGDSVMPFELEEFDTVCHWPLTVGLAHWFEGQAPQTATSTVGIGLASNSLPFITLYFRPPYSCPQCTPLQ